jgi:flagellar protein FlbB
MLLLAVLVVGALVLFDYLGLISARRTLGPLFRLVGLRTDEQVVAAEDPLLLEKERLRKDTEVLELRRQELDEKEAQLAAKEQELQQRSEELQQRSAALEEQQKSFNERAKAYEDRRVNLLQSSANLQNMRPENARDILVNLDDQEIIDILRVTDEEAKRAEELSLVPVWLSLMPPDRAATLTRKMSARPASPLGQ